LADIHFDKNEYGSYKYIKIDEDGERQVLMHGDIFIKDKFSKLTMTIFEKSDSDSSRSGWNGKRGLMISAPAETRKEALDISNSLMKYYLRSYELK